MGIAWSLNIESNEERYEAARKILCAVRLIFFFDEGDVGGDDLEVEVEVEVGAPVVFWIVVVESDGERRLFRDQKNEMLEQEVARAFRDSAYRSVRVFVLVFVFVVGVMVLPDSGAPVVCPLLCPFSAPFA